MAAANRLTQTDYAAALEQRQALRDKYNALVSSFDGVITLGATGAAPKGLESTGDPGFNIPASLLGVPALSLPLLSDQELPLGLQLIGHPNADANLFAIASWVTDVLS